MKGKSVDEMSDKEVIDAMVDAQRARHEALIADAKRKLWYLVPMVTLVILWACNLDTVDRWFIQQLERWK